MRERERERERERYRVRDRLLDENERDELRMGRRMTATEAWMEFAVKRSGRGFYWERG